MAKRDESDQLQGRTGDYLFPKRAKPYTPSPLVRWKVARGLLPKERLILSEEELILLDKLTKQHVLQTKLEDDGSLADY